MVFEHFDENKDNTLSHMEQLRMKATLEEQKMALVTELAKEEQLTLDKEQPETSQSKLPSTSQIKLEIKQTEFIQLCKRVNRIENGMGQVIGHIEDVLKCLAALEKVKVIRRETMTQFLQTIITVR
ncbi:polycystic kidney disease 2 [Schistosoma japonicum]|uniref:Polycystic kidney disease 2 n=1 Tax=Schistosoma japonicum TaxID=6182 RepID=A0A4Z2CVS9_SCHJA|nr:polycystic kidney disease 2 [Schistosoma japonicum]